ncbi:MAG TPA: hypothetical protein VJ225_01895 [Nitrososphaeraceae archaeon]|nr:hypothetical protein [Nitrososphaeraceae archaeon]
MVNDNHKKNTKPIAAADIVMAGAIVTAAIFLSGLSLVGSYQQPVLAQEQQQQQNLTGIGAATGGGGMPGGAINTTRMDGGATQDGNAAITGGAQGNDSMSEVKTQLKEAQTALQNNDTQRALMHLDLAVNAYVGANSAEMNMTGTTARTTGSGAEGDGGILEGGG